MPHFRNEQKLALLPLRRTGSQRIGLKLSEPNVDAGETAAFKRGVTFHEELVEVSTALRTATDFDPALDRQDDPVFLHACFGVERSQRAVFGGGRDGDLDDERGGGRMARGEIGAGAANEAKVRLGLGVTQGDGLLLAQPKTRRHLRADQIIQSRGDAGVERGLGYFLDDDSVDEFGAPTFLIELGELMILRYGDRRDASQCER